MKKLAVGKFKAFCLSILTAVHEKKETYVLTKHGKPIARVVPYSAEEPSSSNSLKDSIVFEKDLVGPVGDVWEADR
jgi:prevent-host-death family protein